jgi:hypothetical protein
MSQQVNREKLVKTTAKTVSKTEKSVKSLADDIFRSLCSEGCQPKDIIGVSSQLLSLVTTELQKGESTPR